MCATRVCVSLCAYENCRRRSCLIVGGIGCSTVGGSNSSERARPSMFRIATRPVIRAGKTSRWVRAMVTVTALAVSVSDVSKRLYSQYRRGLCKPCNGGANHGFAREATSSFFTWWVRHPAWCSSWDRRVVVVVAVVLVVVVVAAAILYHVGLAGHLLA